MLTKRLKSFNNIRYQNLMNLNNILKQIRIIKQYQQNVNTESQLLILNDDCLLNDMLIHVINLQLRMLYLSLPRLSLLQHIERIIRV